MHGRRVSRRPRELATRANRSCRERREVSPFDCWLYKDKTVDGVFPACNCYPSRRERSGNAEYSRRLNDPSGDRDCQEGYVRVVVVIPEGCFVVSRCFISCVSTWRVWVCRMRENKKKKKRTSSFPTPRTLVTVLNFFITVLAKRRQGTNTRQFRTLPELKEEWRNL